MEHPHIQGLSDWSVLARGDYGVVWEARQLSLDRLVAVKVYERQLSKGDRHRFLRAAAEAGRLPRHPGIVTIWDAGLLPEDRPFLILELCRGGSLVPWLKPENRPTTELIQQTGVRIADALAAAHASGVLHRDIKPTNVLLDDFGNAKLADFGLASVGGLKPERAGWLPASPEYAPPEAFRQEPATELGDVYSFAATLYAMLAGRPVRTTGREIVTPEHMAKLSTQPVARIPGVNWFLMRVLMTALSDDPAARPSAAGFRDELAGVPRGPSQRSGPPVSTAMRPSSKPEPSSAPVYAATSGSDAASGAATVGSSGTPDPVWSDVALPGGGIRRAAVLALSALLIAVITTAAFWLSERSAPSGSAPALTLNATPISRASSASAPQASDLDAAPAKPKNSAGASPGHTGIELELPLESAQSFEAVRIQGTYPAGPDTYLRVQRRQGEEWLAFPLPTKTDESGRFTTYVELGQPGRYSLRIVDPKSRTESEPFVLVVKS